ncbi:serine/threonine-protein kinase VRK3 isoform 3-T4 [Theristicus caerulescens]
MAGRGRRGPAGAAPERPGPEAACASLRVRRFCPRCGRGVEPAFCFCPACGGRLPPPEEEEEETERTAPAPPRQQPRSPAASPRASGAARPSSRSPRKARPGPAVPLPAEAVLTDQGGRRWRLVRLLQQGGCGLVYEAQSASGTCPQKQRYSLKLDVKDGKIYNEQNFFQRAAKAGTDCLEYIHENEYVHGDITAENVYLNPADLAQVTLAGYCFAFRYCPGGKHVAQREGSRTPHEGTIEFISLDSHKGAGPSRRSDLESLGYCLLKWLCGLLPWSDELDKVETVMEKKEKYKGDVPCLLRLCFRQKCIPDALQSYLQQVTALEYEEKPDYEALRQLFKKPLEKMKASAYDSVDIKMVP